LGGVAKIELRHERKWTEPSLCCYPEQASDELGLPYRVSSAQSLNLPLPHHVCRFNSLYRPLGSVEGAEALYRPPPSADRSVGLFYYVVEVFNSPQLTVTRQDFLTAASDQASK
jgi:hypothetical protein